MYPEGSWTGYFINYVNIDLLCSSNCRGTCLESHHKSIHPLTSWLEPVAGRLTTRISTSLWCQSGAHCWPSGELSWSTISWNYECPSQSQKQIYPKSKSTRIYIQVHINLDNIAKNHILLEFELRHQLPVGHETGGVDESWQYIVQQTNNVTQKSRWEESVRAPFWKLFQQFNIWTTVRDVRFNLQKEILFISLFLLAQGFSLGFAFQFLIASILIVNLIKAVSGISHDHIKEAFEDFGSEVAL